MAKKTHKRPIGCWCVVPDEFRNSGPPDEQPALENTDWKTPSQNEVNSLESNAR